MEKHHDLIIMNRTFILISLILFLVSCQEKKKHNNIDSNKKKISMIKEKEIIILKEQLKKGLKATIEDAIDYQIEYSNEDIEIEEEIVKDILKQQVYKNISNSEFTNKIESIFHRKLDYNSSKKYIYVDIFNQCNREIIYFQNNLLDFNGFFVFKDNKFIAPIFAVPELLDYQKKFPELIEYEKNIPDKYLNSQRDTIKISKWMNEENLDQQRQQNIQTLVNRNKYLYNDSKASLVWLKFHDEAFLESLVKVFGYVEDRDLLKWVLDRSLRDDKSNEEEFYKILVTKTCDNKYVFHKEVFEVMAQADAKSKKKYLDFLRGRIDLPKIEGLSFSEDARIKALYCYYATKIDKNSMFSFFPKLDDEKYEEEFKRNNYYNLPDFKELYNDTRHGGIGLPM